VFLLYWVIRDTLCRICAADERMRKKGNKDLTDTVCYFHRREDLPDTVWQIRKGRGMRNEKALHNLYEWMRPRRALDNSVYSIRLL